MEAIRDYDYFRASKVDVYLTKEDIKKIKHDRENIQISNKNKRIYTLLDAIINEAEEPSGIYPGV
jgi:hypothetical protein